MIVSDPGKFLILLTTNPLTVLELGMTNANMKLVVLNVTLEDKMETPDSKLDAGEFIVKRVVALDKLNVELKGGLREVMTAQRTDQYLLDYSERGFVVDARLSHFASGYEMAQRVQAGEFNL